MRRPPRVALDTGLRGAHEDPLWFQASRWTPSHTKNSLIEHLYAFRTYSILPLSRTNNVLDEHSALIETWLPSNEAKLQVFEYPVEQQRENRDD